MSVTNKINTKQTWNYPKRACIAKEKKIYSIGKLDFLKKLEYRAVWLAERKMDDSS